MLLPIYKNKIKFEINVLIIIILLFLFRTAVPIFKMPFLVLFGLLFIYLQISYKSKIRIVLKRLWKNNVLIFLLVSLLVISFFLSDKIYLVVFKDVINVIILISFYYLLNFIICKKKHFSYFIKKFIRFILLFAFLISLINILNFYYSFQDYSFLNLDKLTNSYVNGHSHLDYNFALLPVFFGIVGGFYILKKTDTKMKRLLVYSLLITFTINIIISGSRRGMSLLICFVFVLFIIFISKSISKDRDHTKLISFIGFYLLSVLVLFMTTYFLIFHTSYKFKNNSLRFIGVENIVKAKERITSVAYRYIAILDEKTTYSDLFKKIWISSLDPKDPDSGWGSRYHKTVFPLTGNNVEIVPDSAKGYYLDSTSNSNTWNNNAYSFTLIAINNLTKGSFFNVSVYCYVSKDFDGSWARISTDGRIINSNNSSVFYDLSKKGTWQKLSLTNQSAGGIIRAYLYISKYNSVNFLDLKGHVIFAYPQFKILHIKDSVISDMQSCETNTKYNRIENNNNFTKLSSPNIDKLRRLRSFRTGLWHGHYQDSLNIYKKFKFVKAGLYGSEMNLSYYLITSSDSDPIRTLIAKFINEDTTYYGYKSEIFVDTVKNSIIAQRLHRWQFAWQIFLKEYNWPKKIFGGGFDYLNWYGYYFYKDKTRSDWPHNPFLSVLLYSGIVGLLLYIYLMYKVVYYYWLYRKAYPLLGIFFLITFFFSFFSANNPFDPPVMGFFVILPFFIHYIHKKKEKDLISNIDN